jgi:phage gp46-like protein
VLHDQLMLLQNATARNRELQAIKHIALHYATQTLCPLHYEF